MKKPEQRLFRPVTVMRFTIEGDVQNVERVVDADGLEGTEWLKIGVIRKELGIPLTPWMPPS